VLEKPGKDRDALLEAARLDTQALAQDSRWSALADERDAEDPLSDEELADRLIRSGTAVLSELVAQGVKPRTAADGTAQ
jgi:hypothetical protein